MRLERHLTRGSGSGAVTAVCFSDPSGATSLTRARAPFRCPILSYTIIEKILVYKYLMIEINWNSTVVCGGING
jgi:hypothetical protein